MIIHRRDQLSSPCTLGDDQEATDRLHDCHQVGTLLVLLEFKYLLVNILETVSYDILVIICVHIMCVSECMYVWCTPRYVNSLYSVLANKPFLSLLSNVT